MHKSLTRSEVSKELTWDLTDLFSSEEEWEKEMEKLENDLSSVTKFQGKLGDGAEVLYETLEANEDFEKRFVLVATYASLSLSEDGTNTDHQAKSLRVNALQATVKAELSFVEMEILDLSESTIHEFLDKEERLKPYKRYLQMLIDQKSHRLTAETEESLAALDEVFSSPYQTYLRTKLSDMTFEDFEDENGQRHSLTFPSFEGRYESSPQTDTRRNAFASFSSTLKKYQHTFASIYSTEVKKQISMSRLRKYESVTHMLLEPQEVSLDMYHNQLDILQEELAPHMRRFANLKKRVLGLETMNFIDLQAPLDPEFNPTTTIEEGSETVLKSLEVMGTGYHQIMKDALNNRWIDLAENIGKSTGAFCSSPYGVHPYLLVTWTGTMRNAFTLAHELGHAGHFYLAGANQKYINTRPSRYFIEAPSTINELLLAEHLKTKTTDKRMKRWVVLQILGTYYHNFVTHLLEGEMQRCVYESAEAGHPITAKSLFEQKAAVLSSFWGDTVTIDEGASLTWMRQPHYYMGLYPYTYSAGLAASTAVSQMIQEEGQPAVDRWLEVLKAGGTKTPLELLKHVGVDMSNPDTLRKAVSVVGDLVTELEESY